MNIALLGYGKMGKEIEQISIDRGHNVIYKIDKDSKIDKLNGVDVANQKLQYLTPVIGINVNKFIFAYTYTQQMGNVKFDSGGFHQITLGLNFLGGRAEPYDCNCPAIN